MSEFPQPVFQKPPVVETVYSVQFDPLPDFRNAHLGAFWCILGEAWPTVADASLLPSARELFADERMWMPAGLMRIALKDDEASRIQIRNAAGDRMIQLQNGRFIYNWIRGKDGLYPGAQLIRPEFDQMLSKFEAFLKDHRLGPMKPNQWEVTYVNHFVRGTVWQTPLDWPGLFDGKLVQPAAPLSPLELESLGGTWRYVIPERRGRLHVEVIHCRTGPDSAAEEAVILKLTARGPMPKEGGLDAGLQLGHDVVVSSFKKLHSEAARQHWGEKSA